MWGNKNQLHALNVQLRKKVPKNMIQFQKLGRLKREDAQIKLSCLLRRAKRRNSPLRFLNKTHPEDLFILVTQPNDYSCICNFSKVDKLPCMYNFVILLR